MYQSNCIFTNCSRLLFIGSCAPMTYRISLQSLSHHKLSKATSCCQIFFPSLDLCDKNLFVTVHAGAQYVLNTPAIAFTLSFSVSYHKLFKATFHCQLCFHDWYFYRPQRLITNCSRLFPLSDLFIFSSSMRQKINLSLTTRAPSMCWTFTAIALSFIIFSVLPQIVQGYFSLLDLLPWHIASLLSFTDCSRLLSAVRFASLLSIRATKTNLSLTTSRQYVLNIPSNCIALDRSQCPITNCSSLLSTVRFASFRAIRATSNLSLTMKATNMCWTFPAIVLSFIVLGVVPQIVQGHFPVSVVLPWLLSPPSSAPHHKLFNAISRYQMCFLSLESCDKTQFVTDHEGAQYVVNISAISLYFIVLSVLSQWFKASSHCQLCSHCCYRRQSSWAHVLSDNARSEYPASCTGSHLTMLVLNIQPHVLDCICQCLFWTSSLMYWIAVDNVCSGYPAMYIQPHVLDCMCHCLFFKSSLMYWMALTMLVLNIQPHVLECSSACGVLFWRWISLFVSVNFRISELLPLFDADHTFCWPPTILWCWPPPISHSSMVVAYRCSAVVHWTNLICIHLGMVLFGRDDHSGHRTPIHCTQS